MTKKYDNEFKILTVRMIQEKGKSVVQVAREMVLHVNILYRLNSSRMAAMLFQAIQATVSLSWMIKPHVNFRSESVNLKRRTKF